MLATTRGALIRGTTSTDALGDTVTTETAVAGYDDFPLSIIETDDSEFDQASEAWRSVTKLVGRIPFNVPVDEGDLIRDNRTGDLYIVDEFRSTARSISGRASVTLALRRTAP